MSDKMSKDLYLSLLAMDAYNRGYGAGLADGEGPKDADGNDADGLGETGFIKDSIILSPTADIGISTEAYETWKTAGFYAVAYEVADGSWVNEDGSLNKKTTVISYRGTDNPALLSTSEHASDVWSGWVSGAGFPAGQSKLAFEFYEAVTGHSAFKGNADNVVLTGHSLGGGLAGAVAAISGNEAVIVDPMPYTHLAATYALSNPAYDADTLDGSNIKNIYQEGEGLEYFRDYIAEGFWKILSLAGLIVEGSSDNLNGRIDALAQGLSAQSKVLELDNIWETINPNSLHAQQLKPLYLFAEESPHYVWPVLAGEAFNALFDTTLARHLIGPEGDPNPGATAAIDSKLRSAIAYSTLKEGTLVFGDSGMSAFCTSTSGTQAWAA